MSSHASLNHIFRSIWNDALGAMVAVPEMASSSGAGASSRSKRGLKTRLPRPGNWDALALGIALAWGTALPGAQANPVGGVAIHGQASFATNGNTLKVTTQNGANTSHSAINWQSFSIPTGNTTYFQQPTAASTAINRVVTNTPSLIFGTLSSNGNLVLVNQAGITVGAGAVVDTAAFTASALRMTDADAIAGRLRFGDGTASAAGLSVQGSILARSGDVVLLAPNIDTGKDALIQAPNGNTILAAGQQIELTGRGLEGIKLQVQAPSNTALNLGTLKGDAVAIFAGTLKHSGDIQASTLSLEGGKIVLKATGDVFVEGNGKLTATGTSGGTVDVLGNRVAVKDQAAIDVSGGLGGGTVRIGGDLQGKNPDIQNASFTYTGLETSIKANALTRGNGGKVVVWADDTTRAYGAISARGGAQSGNGGFVETSGKRALDIGGARVDASAPNGSNGQWLLDPYDVTIVHGSTESNLGGSLFNPAYSSSIGDVQINAALNAGTDVYIQTSNGEVGNGSIVVNGTADIGGAVAIANTNVGTRNLALNTSGTINLHSGATVNAGSNGFYVNMSSGGNVVVNGDINVSATSISSGGNISGTGAIVTPSLSTQSATGTVLNGVRNQVGNWTASNSGLGALQLATSGSISLGSITNAGGAVTVNSTNGISVTNSVTATDSVILAAGAGDLTQTSGNISNVGQGTTGAPGMSLSGNNITLRSVQSAGGVLLNSSGSVNLLGLGSGGFIDDTFFTYSLPFTFNYFGTNYNQAFITTNGLITFGSGTASYTDSVSALSGIRAISPAWNDWILNASDGKDIRIAPSANSLGVRWNVGRYGNSSQTAQFESILNPNGAIQFNYGAANSTFANDVTIGISNGSGINLISVLMSEPNFSMNNLRSTTFTPNGSGSYTETLSAGSTPLSVFGTISGSAILGQGTGEVITAAGALRINAGGLINAPSRLSAQSLQFQSHGGAQFTGYNIFSAIGASANSIAGGTNGSSSEVLIYNNPAATQLSPLLLADLANDAGGITLNNTGGIQLSGQLRASGAVALTAQTGAITQLASEPSTGIFAPSLITSSASGTTLNYSGNQIGSFTANNAASGNVQMVTMGSLAFGSVNNPLGQVQFTSTSGNLNLGAINGSSITLLAPVGSISQSAGFSSTGLLSTISQGSTVLDHRGNSVAIFRGTTTGAGNLSLTNVGVINIQEVNVANGNFVLNNTGGVTTSGKVTIAHGPLSITANSPLTIGSAGLSASGDIVLTATNLTSSGDVTLNGPITSSDGSILMSAANNFTQNSAVKAALGVTAAAGASLVLGPLATTDGHPVVYTSNGAAALIPPATVPAPTPTPVQTPVTTTVPAPVVTPTQPAVTVAETPVSKPQPTGSSPTDFVVAFLSSLDKTLSSQDAGTLDPAKSTKKTKDGVVTEAQTCSR